MSAAEGDRRRGVRRSGAVGVAGEVEAGEEGLEGRVAVDEGGEEVGPILDDGAEGEDEEGEEEEGEEVRGEGGGGLSEELRRAAEVVQPGMVIAHRAFSGRTKNVFFCGFVSVVGLVTCLVCVSETKEASGVGVFYTGAGWCSGA